MDSSRRVSAVRARRRPTRAGVVLSTELIVDTVLRLIDGPAGDKLSVRRVGAALGADPTAIYRYFRSLDAILLAVADRLIGEATAGFVPGPDLGASLRDLAGRIYRSMRAHPRLAQLRAHRFIAGPHELQVVDMGIGLLLRAGFAPADAVRHYRDFIDTAFALAALDVSDVSPEQERADWETWLDAARGLPAGDYPNVHAVRDQLPAMAESAFPGVLKMMIAVLEREAAERAGGAPAFSG
ncbi:TetR/AcrR family transcriptional regulator [Dactylosporangium sp. AC04546]|uniref:TetR/AcrR family transcriptional regulator n=1 Tax=Dactylosporangium sp. AC04546 TaxID=2862460 RepID=UPI001EDFB3C8|nr:TetR/AcrR family transcriptional regulator [Dactylosporangium sp. AC04546]WVK88530.1 TetR/AcrR family transcriptional regulator [Dactylosporangium sp. AC04546]